MLWQATALVNAEVFKDVSCRHACGRDAPDPSVQDVDMAFRMTKLHIKARPIATDGIGCKQAKTTRCAQQILRDCVALVDQVKKRSVASMSAALKKTKSIRMLGCNSWVSSQKVCLTTRSGEGVATKHGIDLVHKIPAEVPSVCKANGVRKPSRMASATMLIKVILVASLVMWAMRLLTALLAVAMRIAMIAFAIACATVLVRQESVFCNVCRVATITVRQVTTILAMFARTTNR